MDDRSEWREADRAERVARGKRLRELRKSLGVTVLDMAERLNAVAGELGVPQRWTGPKVAKIEVGTQNLLIEDVACLAAYDPHERGWFWWAFGREEPAVQRAPIGKHRTRSGARDLPLTEPQRPVIPRRRRADGR